MSSHLCDTCSRETVTPFCGVSTCGHHRAEVVKTSFLWEGTVDLKMSLALQKYLFRGLSAGVGVYRCLFLSPVHLLGIHQRRSTEASHKVQGMLKRFGAMPKIKRLPSINWREENITSEAVLGGLKTFPNVWIGKKSFNFCKDALQCTFKCGYCGGYSVKTRFIRCQMWGFWWNKSFQAI